MITLTNDQIIDFLVENYPPCFTWERDFIIKWYNWYKHFHLSETIVDFKNEIVAIAFARPIQKPEDGLDEYHFDPMGSCLFVDLTVVKDERSKSQLYDLFVKKMGHMQTIAFKRSKYSKMIRCYPFEKFMLKFIKGTKEYGRR